MVGALALDCELEFFDSLDLVGLEAVMFGGFNESSSILAYVVSPHLSELSSVSLVARSLGFMSIVMCEASI